MSRPGIEGRRRGGRHPNALANLAKSRGVPGKARHSYAKLAEIVAILTRGRRTVRNVMAAANISKTSAHNWVHALHDAGCIHIVEYARTRNNGHGAAIYEWGSADDAPFPVGMSAAERSRRLRRKKATLEGAWRIPT